MSASGSQALLSTLQEQVFESERENATSVVAKRIYFACTQVIEVINRLDFSNEQPSVMRALASIIVDKEDSHVILSAFRFGRDQSKARQILNQ